MTIPLKFLFDIKTFLEVLQLVKPQNKSGVRQTRWVMVESVKLLQKKKTFEFTEGKEYILTEIQFAKLGTFQQKLDFQHSIL
jgi:hypothetical protein